MNRSFQSDATHVAALKDDSTNQSPYQDRVALGRTPSGARSSQSHRQYMDFLKHVQGKRLTIQCQPSGLTPHRLFVLDPEVLEWLQTFSEDHHICSTEFHMLVRELHRQSDSPST